MHHPETDLAARVRACADAAGACGLAAALGLPPVPGGGPDGVALALPGEDELPPLRAVAERKGLLAVHARLGADRGDVARLVRGVTSRDPARQHLFLLTGERSLVVACRELTGPVRRLTIDREEPDAAALRVLADMVAEDGEGGVELRMRYARALDRQRLGERFFAEFRMHRSRIAAAWLRIGSCTERDRSRLALLLLCRLLFLAFLQEHGRLAGDRRWLSRLRARWRAGALGGGGFYRSALAPLFFGVLNRRPETRDADARRLGELPYLNGGLFDRTPLERSHRNLDLPDDVALAALQLLDAFRVSPRESAESLELEEEASIDPEMLGRVFEDLMDPDERGDTGTYFTPPALVAGIVREALARYAVGSGGSERRGLERSMLTGDVAALTAGVRRDIDERLASVTVLDPACGSGAFLLGAMIRISELRGRLAGVGRTDARRQAIARGLYGVDVQDDAALLCSLRLWLAMWDGEGEPPPLPNLDRRIRQGDALLSPAEVTGGRASIDPALRAAVRALEPLAAAYVATEPEQRVRLRVRIARAERRVADAWLTGIERRQRARERELRARAAERDLFGDRTSAAYLADGELLGLEEERATTKRMSAALRRGQSMPFFSFDVHFAEAAVDGFGLVLSNPPWVRPARWSKSTAAALRRRFPAAGEGWTEGARITGTPAGAARQTDMAALFLERSIGLLAPGGVLGMLLPAKLLRSLHGGGARRLLLERAPILTVQDHALDARGAFRADAFACAVVARRSAPGEQPADGEAVGIRMTRPGVAPLEFETPRRELSLLRDDPASPWMLAPPDARSALRAMQEAGPPLGRAHRVRRGVLTGANRVLVLRDVRPKLGGLVLATPEGGGEEVLVEGAALAPLVRGAGVDAWRYDAPDHVVWLRDPQGRRVDAPRRMERYLAANETRLRVRSGGGRLPLGAVLRVSPDTLRPKVAWHDLSDTVRAVALPAKLRTSWGGTRPLVPLNTVYFVPADHEADALVLAALLNSLPVRTFARAIAERAKDARFRFFAWTMAMVPRPRALLDPAARERLLTVSAAAHERGALDEHDRGLLDDVVAWAYGLTPRQWRALESFDCWLRGEAQ